jgi:membrane protein involved in D-alanine export
MLDSDLKAGELFFKILSCCICLLAARLCLLVKGRGPRSFLFLLANVAGVYYLCALTLEQLILYLMLVACLYVVARGLAFSRIWLVAVLAPLAVLVCERYSPLSTAAGGAGLLGLSYMAFRLSQLVVIVRNRITPMPGLLDYLSFSFFAPTFVVGPISAYSTFASSFSSPDSNITPERNCVLRILVGATKFLFFGNIIDRLTYRGLLLDGHPHHFVDLIVAAVAYYLYLYCNFSGICDIAVGSAGLLGIKVSENFAQPFSARNMREYWNRWHITLSAYMRDMFFTPVSKALVRGLPASFFQHAIAATIVMVFILIGIWHGRELHYLVWGAMNALGVALNFYYGLILKKYLNKEQLQRYQRNRLIEAACIAITFVYVCICLFFFANNFATIQAIFNEMKF